MRLLVIIVLLKIVTSARSEAGLVDAAPQDPILINFKRVKNGSYLPSEANEPLIIDNRALPIPEPPVVIDSVTKIDLSDDWLTPSKDLRGAVQDGERDGRLYLYPFSYRSGQRTSPGNRSKLGTGGRIRNSEVVRVNDMSCRYSGEDLYFGASLLSLRRTDHPLVDNVSNEACKIVKTKTEYRLRFEKENFWNCGVTDCSTEAGTLFCVTVRFPTISGLRLKDDVTVTLQCKTQDKTASHTTRINVKTLNTAARMAPRVASGGLKNAFQTDIGLFRKSYGSENLFDVKITPGGTVVLGEEILLRALVRDGDGWRYSRIGEVSVQYVESRRQQRVMNSLWILDADGCRNPDIFEICPGDQYRVAPLESYLIFEAFMFENMKETDEMIVSVKVIGCLEGEDCAFNCPKDALRTRRATSLTGLKAQESKANVTDWQSDIAFKVIRKVTREESENRGLGDPRLVVPYVLTVFVLAISMSLLCLVRSMLRQRSNAKE